MAETGRAKLARWVIALNLYLSVAPGSAMLGLILIGPATDDPALEALVLFFCALMTGSAAILALVRNTKRPVMWSRMAALLALTSAAGIYSILFYSIIPLIFLPALISNLYVAYRLETCPARMLATVGILGGRKRKS